jgi:hypothetical protein
MNQISKIVVVVAITFAAAASRAQNAPISVLGFQLGKPLPSDFPEEKRARQVAEIFKSTVETVKVERPTQDLFQRFELVVMYPERVVVNVGAERAFSNLETCLSAYSKAAAAISAAYGFRVLNQGSQTHGDIEVSLGCMLKGQSRESQHNLLFLARSIEATDTWLAREAMKHKK